MPDQDLHHSLLQVATDAVAAARAAGAADAWGYASRRRETEFSVRDGKLEKVSEATGQSLSLEVWVDGRYASAATTDLRPDEIGRLGREVVALARALQPDPHRQIPDPALFAGRATVDLDLVDAGIQAMSREEREALCQAQNLRLAGKDKVISATSGSTDGHAVSASVSSNGFSGSHEATWLWLGSEVTLQDAAGRPEGWMSAGGPHRAQVPAAELVADEAMRRARERLGSKKGPTAKGVMVVEPSAAGRLLTSLLQPGNAASVQQGRSFWKERLGKKAVSARLSLVDDPLLPRGLASRLFDGEGIAARRLPIIEEGVFANLYVDTYYGRKLGMAPTTGGPSNRLVLPGKRDLAAILADLDQGVLVTSWLGGNADPTTGDFSLGMRGHSVVKGQVGPPIGEMNVTGNLVDLFARLTEVGSDPWVYSSLQSPTLVFEGVDFSGA